MSGLYVDTSALGRVLRLEPDKPAIERALGGSAHHLSSRLLGIELRRLALREGLGDRAEDLLADIAFLPLDETVLAAAERIEPHGIATLDAIHLATAVAVSARSGLDAIVTYDLRLAEGARHHGIEVVSPA